MLNARSSEGSGSGDSELSLVNVGGLLAASIAELRASHHPSARITCEFDDQLRVLCVPRELQQVFVHLLNNAAESLNQAGDPQREGIRVAGWRSAQERTIVEISDTGSGIAPEHLAHVFEDAFTTKLDDLQTGRELALSRGLIAPWGGTISVRCSSQMGSSFRVELPSQPPPRRTTRSDLEGNGTGQL